MSVDPRLVTPDIRLVAIADLKKGQFVKAVPIRTIPAGAGGVTLWSNYGLTPAGAGDAVFGVARQDCPAGQAADIARDGDGAPLILADASCRRGEYLKSDANGHGTEATFDTDNIGARVTFSGQMAGGFIGVTVALILSTDP